MPENHSKNTWFVFKIVAEFVDGFEELKSLGPAVSIFGSSRLPKNSPYINMAQNVARELSKMGFSIITGGGPSIMEAANKGAQQGKSTSVGLNIEIPAEQHPNPYIDVFMEFKHFFARKVMFVRYASAFIICPGGYGTLDEFFEALTLIQTGKKRRFPVILMGKKYWQGLVDWLEDSAMALDTISEDDRTLFTMTDSPVEAARIVKNAWLKYRKDMKRHKIRPLKETL